MVRAVAPNKKTRAQTPVKIKPHLNPALEKFLVPIASLKFDPKNPRTHSTRNIQTIKHSLAEYGQQIPIITKDSIVIKGNGTLQAAKELGWTHIAAMPFNHPEKKKVRGFALIDNRSGELADWDMQVLGAELAELQADGLDLIELGWDQHEFEPLLSADWKPPEISEQVSFETSGKKAIHFTAEEFRHVAAAIGRVHRNPKLKEITDAEAIVVICKAYGS